MGSNPDRMDGAPVPTHERRLSDCFESGLVSCKNSKVPTKVLPAVAGTPYRPKWDGS